MSTTGDCLGICFAERQLYFACSDTSRAGHVVHIGCIEANVSPYDALTDAQNSSFDGLKQTLQSLKSDFGCRSIRLLSPSWMECWTTFPRIVYEDPDEREDHLSMLMEGVPRSKLESTWHELSNQEYKLLMVRNRALTDNYRALAAGFGQTDFVSEFELGMEWQTHTDMSGSYLMVHASPGQLSIASFLLRKLRGATFFTYENLRDLPYLWSYFARDLTWMNGYHEHVYVYGESGLEVSEALNAFFRETGQLHLMNKLDKMDVHADEKTYGFKLESAFPAILLSLNAGTELQVGTA